MKVHLDADAPQSEIDDLVAHARTWSPVANTFSKPVPVNVETV